MTARRSRLPAPRRCGYYRSGHEVHWIQGLHSGKDTEHPRVPGRLLSISDDGTLDVEINGESITLWNHESARLRLLVEPNGGAISLQLAWSILWTPGRDGSYAFSVCDPDDPEWRPCPSEPPTGGLIDLAREAGGFSMSVGEAKERLRSSGR